MTAERRHCITLENYKGGETRQCYWSQYGKEKNAAACVELYMDFTCCRHLIPMLKGMH